MVSDNKIFQDFQYLMPTKIIFKTGGISELTSLSIQLGTKPFIVTGRQSSKKNGALEKLKNTFTDAIVFDEVEENPTIETCDNAGEICRKNQCDWIIGVGGGSPLDVSKVVAGLATNTGKCEQYFGKDLFRNAPLPVLAIPTTAGTGSEVTPYAVITNTKNNTKQTIADYRIFPTIALLDPILTRTLPHHITLSTGLDALSQSMEGMVSKKATPITDYLAKESCKLIFQWLPKVLNDPEDIEGRYWLLYASLLSGIVIAQTGTTLVHALGYFYTLNYKVPHGIANALFLIPMFKRNISFFPEKLKFIVDFLHEEYSNQQPELSIEKALNRFFNEIKFSKSASTWGVFDNQFDVFAKQLYADSYRFRNQYGEFSVDDIFQIFKESF